MRKNRLQWRDYPFYCNLLVGFAAQQYSIVLELLSLDILSHPSERRDSMSALFCSSWILDNFARIDV